MASTVGKPGGRHGCHDHHVSSWRTPHVVAFISVLRTRLPCDPSRSRCPQGIATSDCGMGRTANREAVRLPCGVLEPRETAHTLCRPAVFGPASYRGDEARSHPQGSRMNKLDI